MKKKFSFRKRLCCSVAAILSLFAVCGHHLYAANGSESVDVSMTVSGSQQSLQEATGEALAPNFTLTFIDDESVSSSGVSITDEVIPYGLWDVTQVVCEKNADKKAVKNTLKNAAEVQSLIPCPLKWEILNSKELVMYFPDDKKETLEYTLKDGQLIINYIGAIFQYQYSVNNDILTLTATFKNGNTEENLIITSKMQN